MKIKKAILALNNQVSQKTEVESQALVLVILRSYELQLRYGCDSKITALSNSIYTPTLSSNSKKETELKEQKKVLTKPKYRTALRHIELIKEMRKNGSSFNQIANYLNQYIVHNSRYFNTKFIERFSKKHHIN